MKKFLAMLGSLSLITFATSSLVSCTNQNVEKLIEDKIKKYVEFASLISRTYLVSQKTGTKQSDMLSLLQTHKISDYISGSNVNNLPTNQTVGKMLPLVFGRNTSKTLFNNKNLKYVSGASSDLGTKPIVGNGTSLADTIAMILSILKSNNGVNYSLGETIKGLVPLLSSSISLDTTNLNKIDQALFNLNKSSKPLNMILAFLLYNLQDKNFFEGLFNILNQDKVIEGIIKIVVSILPKLPSLVYSGLNFLLPDYISKNEVNKNGTSTIDEINGSIQASINNLLSDLLGNKDSLSNKIKLSDIYSGKLPALPSENSKDSIGLRITNTIDSLFNKKTKSSLNITDIVTNLPSILQDLEDLIVSLVLNIGELYHTVGEKTDISKITNLSNCYKPNETNDISLVKYKSDPIYYKESDSSASLSDFTNGIKYIFTTSNDNLGVRWSQFINWMLNSGTTHDDNKFFENKFSGTTGEIKVGFWDLGSLTDLASPKSSKEKINGLLSPILYALGQSKAIDNLIPEGIKNYWEGTKIAGLIDVKLKNLVSYRINQLLDVVLNNKSLGLVGELLFDKGINISVVGVHKQINALLPYNKNQTEEKTRAINLFDKGLVSGLYDSNYISAIMSNPKLKNIKDSTGQFINWDYIDIKNIFSMKLGTLFPMLSLTPIGMFSFYDLLVTFDPKQDNLFKYIYSVSGKLVDSLAKRGSYTLTYKNGEIVEYKTKVAATISLVQNLDDTVSDGTNSYTGADGVMKLLGYDPSIKEAKDYTDGSVLKALEDFTKSSWFEDFEQNFISYDDSLDQKVAEDKKNIYSKFLENANYETNIMNSSYDSITKLFTITYKQTFTNPFVGSKCTYTFTIKNNFSDGNFDRQYFGFTQIAKD